jgi:hypothetical protein
MALAKLKNALFTHEDTFNVHKLFGFPVLLHFIVRTLSVFRRPFADMGFTATPFTLGLILMHLSLSISSLIFKLPKKRIAEGSRIWPEFRLHSIVFACRSLACMAIVWVEKAHNLTPMYWANVAVCFATLIAADVATSSVDPVSRSNTIRGLDTSAAYKFAFSFMQFLGTTGCMFGLRAFAGQFAIVFIIQTYAFTLTLRRKNLVSHRATVFIYSYQLSIGAAVAQIEIWQAGGAQALFMFPCVAACAMLLRVGLGLNKYLVWAIVGGAIQLARRTTEIVPAEQRFAEWPAWGWPVGAVVALSCAFGLFVVRSRQRAAAAQSGDKKAE